MVTHSNFLAWKIPRTKDPDGLQFMGSLYIYVCVCVCTHIYGCKHRQWIEVVVGIVCDPEFSSDLSHFLRTCYFTLGFLMSLLV